MKTKKTTKKSSVLKAVKTVVKKALKIRDLPYKATIKVLGKLYHSSGTTAKDAIENLKVHGVAKGMSVIEMTHGEVKRSKILMSPQTFRLFSPSRLTREIALKHASLMFDGL